MFVLILVDFVVVNDVIVYDKCFYYIFYRLVFSIKDDEIFDLGCGNIW